MLKKSNIEVAKTTTETSEHSIPQEIDNREIIAGEAPTMPNSSPSNRSGVDGESFGGRVESKGNRVLEDITQAAEILRTQTDSSDGQLITTLVEAGFDQALATRLVEFIPLAYSRVWLADSGVQFEDYYLRVSADGKTYTEHNLEDEPVYREAVAAAQSEITAGSGFDELLPIVGRSAEFKAINSALNDGAMLEDLELSAPVLLWEDEETS